MAYPNLSFLAGLVVLAYLSTFVLFALLRIITGVSIQRLGFSGLRRLSYTPREGIRLDIRGIGLRIHRPTFAQPTWISIVLAEPKITIDLKIFGRKKSKTASSTSTSTTSTSTTKSNGSLDATPVLGDEAGSSSDSEGIASPDVEVDEEEEEEAPRSRTWEKLVQIKERIKRLHRQIKWIRMVDLVATNSAVTVLEVGTLEVTSFTMAVDTRRKTVDRSRLFQHSRVRSEKQSPAEWIFAVRGILFSPEGNDATELLDHCTLNVHGMLYEELDGLRDASIALKLGRLSLPFDDIQTAIDRIHDHRVTYGGHTPQNSEAHILLQKVIREIEHPGSHEDNIVQTVSDSKEFASSILRGIQEIQFAVSFFGLSKRVRTLHPSGSPVYINMSMKEVGFDVLRLDPRSPAHLMYFSPNDIAHQALIAAIAISVGIDNGQDHPERLLYVPMATATVKTTLPAQTIQIQKDKNVNERNMNMLFANLVVTSPSIDLDPRHLPLIIALLHSFRNERGTKRRPGTSNDTKQRLLSRLLPKASVKISIHEPVIRVTLPPMGHEKDKTDKFDLLISAMSSISLDVESSHSAGGELHYSLASNLRINRHQLYYQMANRDKHNLLMTDNGEVKVQVSASPEVAVVATANIQTFALYLVRPEISEGLRQIVTQLRKRPSRRGDAINPRPNFLRRLPPWLLHFSLTGTDFNFEVAGVDPSVSEHARGVALHLESWTAEYKANKSDDSELRTTRRRAASRSFNQGDNFLRPVTPSSPRKPKSSVTDGRRLAIHTQGFEASVIESAEAWEPESFLSLPRFEVAFTTSTDPQGPVFHVNSFARSLFCQYSLYRHFAVGVAVQVLRKTFKSTHVPGSPPIVAQMHSSSPIREADTLSPGFTAKPEIITYDFRAGFIQIKATMPADPSMMLQLYGVEAGRHRWATPFARARLIRLYAETPNIKRVWGRIVSIKTFRLDYRLSKRKYGTTFIQERSIDILTDAIRLAIPHQLVLHKVFDNFTSTIKTVKQLHHRFQTGTDEDILDKDPEGPKHVPRISLRSQAALFEIEDGSFEWKLGCIYRLGLLEQRQRLAREEAFHLKVKKLNEQAARRGNRYRTKSAHQRGRSKNRKESNAKSRKSKSSNGDERPESPWPDSRGRQMRYDTEGTCELTDTAQRSSEKAWEKLQELNARSWKQRIDHGMKFQNRAMQDIRSLFWGLDEDPDEAEQPERILAIPQRPGLMAVLVSDLNILIDKPSFPINEYPTFLNRVGKGMPLDMEYSLLIPMHIQVSMGEARVTLRDYPLPLLHIPAIRSGQSPRLASLSMYTDFVIAEEFRDQQSTRHVNVVVVPPERNDAGELVGGFCVDVRRTVSPVKTYSDMKIEINTAYPTRITWGTSYQPAIQDMMQVIEGFTKPAVDPSERVGFWDKIRLNFHSKISVAWKGDGDVHLILKGSRDPYLVTGTGAGFVMCWRNNVRLNVCQHPDQKRFLTVDSGVYVLAIPDLSHYARQVSENDLSDRRSTSSLSAYEQGAIFKKTVMKLSNNVRWVVGLVFERNTETGGRSFDFKPHYQVVLKSPEHVKPRKGETYDAFRGFRSNHIHMSLAIAAPADRDWKAANLKPTSLSTYNSVHLTPRFFSHFFSWWSMFSGVMALPIRQGKLWPGAEKSNKKFSRHLATIKYNLLLSPLFLSHIYKHKDAEDYGSSVVSATGLKIRLDSFTLDIHQRREEFWTEAKGNNKKSRTTGMRINQAQLDFLSADIRAVSATISGTDSSDIEHADDETLASYQQKQTSPVDLSRFAIPDNDLNWIDMDDFVELDWVLPAETNPETKILPLVYSPRFTYIRQTDNGESISGDPSRTSPFGKEDTHYCVMSSNNDPRRVQVELIKERLARLQEQILQHQRLVGEQELKLIKGPQGSTQMHSKLEALRKHTEILQTKKEFLQKMLRALERRLDRDEPRFATNNKDGSDDEFFEAREDIDMTDRDAEGMDAAPLADYTSDFSNRFVVHNAQIKWTNPLRNIILRYIHQVSQRRGFVYYMSRRAVKFILDIVEEQQRSRDTQTYTSSPNPSSAKTPDMSTPVSEAEPDIHDRINQLLQDGKKFVNADDPGTPSQAKKRAGDDIASEFTAQNAYHVRLVAPQIQLQSEKNPKSAILITAKGMQLKVVQIMDKDRVSDDISGLVQRRFAAAMDSMQIFVTNSKTFSTEYLHMYSGNRYGVPAGSSWPPWVPFEIMFEFNNDPFGFQRVIQRTSASLRYDKFNTLRLKYNDDVSSGQGGEAKHTDQNESRIDHLWVEFPHVRAIADSSQYYAIYIIVLDLLLYNEPLEKTRTERLEKIMLASDFSDLTGAPEMVIALQERIRQLEEIKNHFAVNEKYLDKQGWKDRIDMEQDLAACEDELFFMMKAITTSQRKTDERAQPSQSTGLLKYDLSAAQIVWHLRNQNEPLAEFQLNNAMFERTDNNDGSNLNYVEIQLIRGLNLLPDAVYPDMIGPFREYSKTYNEGDDSPMLRVKWLMLEAIAGIPVLDHFEVNLFPIKVQLEREVGKKLFEYVFPSTGEHAGSSPFLVKQRLPAQPEEDESGGDEPLEGRSLAETADLGQPQDNTNTTDAGSLQQRLQPTLNLPDKKPTKSEGHKHRFTGHYNRNDLHPFKFLTTQDRSTSDVRKSTASTSKEVSSDTLVLPYARPTSSRSPSMVSTSQTGSDTDKSKRFALHRSETNKPRGDKNGRSDDLSMMMNRASNYMTLAYVKVPSVVLCLSYKGKGQRNFEDVHDLVFRMPTLEYRNKTWSNLDLALQLKKDVIRALISHAGAIVGNKFSHHRPNKQQQARLRDIANASIVLSNGSSDISGLTSESASIKDISPADGNSTRSEQSISYTSRRDSNISMSGSLSSSMLEINQNRESAGMGGGPLHRDMSRTRSLTDRSEGTGSVHHDHESLRSSITRHFTIGQRAKSRDGEAEDTEESNRRKGKLLLGKKFLHSLPHPSRSEQS